MLVPWPSILLTMLQSHLQASYNSLVSEAVRLLVPPAIFEASNLNVVFMGKGLKNCSAIIPRTYILSHCDFTANLTLTISNVINLDQLKGWYNNDDVVAEWKKVKETIYHIFSKELPLVLKAVLHGDSALFVEHPELMDAFVCVYFHSSLPKYNRMECWGSLKDAAEFSDLNDFVHAVTLKRWNSVSFEFKSTFVTPSNVLLLLFIRENREIAFKACFFATV
ncbi:Protein STAY-GREEN LIKE [Hibiscus syriacus]|uniref:Protein STAY-GREEN LIKE n=1 Tax=Hibiscus syriacus TaxID=106335 RepID=A0A6A3D374_HIBSY|nr:Protein STAY-GREEN LIKE [Hibiscus syriacus]